MLNKYFNDISQNSPRYCLPHMYQLCNPAILAVGYIMLQSWKLKWPYITTKRVFGSRCQRIGNNLVVSDTKYTLARSLAHTIPDMKFPLDIITKQLR